MIFSLKSPSGFPLVTYAFMNERAPFITIELSDKWYSLFIVRPSLDYFCKSHQIEVLNYHALVCEANKDRTLFVDHVPNPEAVEAYAESRGMEINALALELMHGRWLLEVLSR